MLRLWNKKFNHNFLNNSSIGTKLRTKVLNEIQCFKFSGGGHHSGSGSDHSEHSDHDDHGHDHYDGFHVIPPEIDFKGEERKRIFGTKVETFSVDKMLESVNKAIHKTASPEEEAISMFKSQTEYVDFLAKNFEKIALQKYPEYKKKFEEYKDYVPSEYTSLNSYQKEVHALDTYMWWKLEKQQQDIRKNYSFNKDSSLEEIRAKKNFFNSKIIYLYKP